MPIVRNVIKPQNKHKNPTGSKKKFSCKIPCVSIYSTDTAFRKIQAIPKQRKIPPMAIDIRFIFALLVSLEFVINVNELPFFSKQELLAMRRKYQGLLYGMRGNITIVFNLKRGERQFIGYC